MPIGALAVPLLFVAALAGAVLLWLGYRGRRVGDHLHCTKCEFDLYGMPCDASRCPECGTLIRYGAPRGRRERNQRFIGSGAVLLIAALPVLGIFIVTEMRQISWAEKMPLWYLTQRVSMSADTKMGDEDLDELTRRINKALVPSPQLQPIAKMLLDYQLDVGHGWNPKIGMLFERLHGSGVVSKQDWLTYLDHAVQPVLRIRPEINKSDPIAAAIDIRPARGGKLTGIQAAITLEAFRIDDQRVDITALLNQPELSGKQPAAIPSQWPFALDSQPLASGPHVARLEFSVLTIDSIASLSANRSHTSEMKFTVNNEDRPPPIRPVTLGQGSRLIRDWRETNGMSPPYLRPDIRRVAPGRIMITLQFRSTPIYENADAFAFDAIVVHGDTELSVGAGCWEIQTNRLWQTILTHDIPSDWDTVDLILRPSLDRALRNINITSYVNTEFVLTNMRIRG